MQKIYQGELLQVIQSDLSKQEILERLENYHFSDIADALEQTATEKRLYIYSVLGLEKTAEIVEDVVESDVEIIDAYYIEISEMLFYAREIIGLQYDEDSQTYNTPMYWSASTGDINYRNSNVALVKKLDEMEQAIIEKANVSHTHSANAITETSDAKVMTAAERTKLNGIAEGANNYVHPSTHPASMITELPTSLPANGGNADTVDNMHASDFATANHNHDANYSAISHDHDSAYASVSHTHAQSDVTGLETALAGKSDTNHTHTASAIGAAAASHNHDSAYVPFDLFGFNTSGGVEYSYGSGSGKNVLTEISNMPQGLHTIYAITGTTGNPETAESYRYFIHKTSGTIGWIYAFGADGSIYSNYQSAAGTFKGWRTIHDVKRKPLWSSARYMTADHTVTPSKKLSECEHGWMLLWSDYDPDTATINDTDFCTTMIPNRNWAGNTWNGSSYYCDVPRYSAGTATDSESRVIKVLTVYDNKLVGSDNNKAAPRNDVVLRAVYEF